MGLLFIDRTLLLPITVLSALSMTYGGELPDFSQDYYVIDVVSESSNINVIYDLRYQNEDKPDHCRGDLCYPETTSNTMDNRNLGSFQWKTTVLGSRMFLRCPYSVYNATYAYRDCVLDDGNATWSEQRVGHCPDPPIRELIKQFNYTENVTGNEYLELNWYVASVSAIHDVIYDFEDQPIRGQDVASVVSIGVNAVFCAVTSLNRLPLDSITDIFTTLDFLMRFDKLQHDGLFFRRLASDTQTRLVGSLALLCEMLPDGHDMELDGDVMTMKVSVVSGDNDAVVNASFHNDVTVNYTVALPPAVVSVGVGSPGAHCIHILYIGWTEFLNVVLHLPHTNSSKEQFRPLRQVLKAIVKKQVLSRGKRDLIADMIAYEKLLIIAPILYVGVSNVDRTSPAFQGSSTKHFSPWNRQQENVTVQFSSGITGYGCRAHCATFDIMGQLSSGVDHLELKEWLLDCSVWASGDGSVCGCNSVGLKTVAGECTITTSSTSDEETDGYYYDYYYDYEAPMVFFGFPYKEELYIVGHVLRAISLLCLVLTVASYALFRDTRRGTPTRILLNLCASLIALQVAFYVAEGVAGDRVGCRVSNMFRYYLVLVSLLWNAAEAVNMYLMLVRVFNSAVSRFVLKAALVAWGLPLLAIAVVVAVNEKNFDGLYLDDCSFRCQLKPYVLYFAYLLPMGLIIIHNLVMFALVIKSLQGRSTVPSSKESSPRDHCIRLSGAISILVLLGVPWIFSSFGAIDAGSEDNNLALVEEIFQVIFVVSVNLQGCFIFAFHCLRNTDMRAKWKSVVTRSTTLSEGASQQRHSNSADRRGYGTPSITASTNTRL